MNVMSSWQPPIVVLILHHLFCHVLLFQFKIYLHSTIIQYLLYYAVYIHVLFQNPVNWGLQILTISNIQ